MDGELLNFPPNCYCLAAAGGTRLSDYSDRLELATKGAIHLGVWAFEFSARAKV